MLIYNKPNLAEVAELVDAPALGAGTMSVQVRVLSSAQIGSQMGGFFISPIYTKI